jgi:hypothetical protein
MTSRWALARQRKRRGRRLVTVEIDLVAVSEQLVEDGFLPAWDCESLDAVRDALQKYLDRYATEALHDDGDAVAG